MLNPKIVYIAVAIVFVYIVARIKLIPYLAAKKILKDAKRNGTQQPTDMTAAAPLIPLQFNPLHSALLAMNGCTAPPASGRPECHNICFECRIVDVSKTDEGLGSHEEEEKRIDHTVNQLFIDLRKRCIFPDALHMVQISDGLLMVYATYTL